MVLKRFTMILKKSINYLPYLPNNIDLNQFFEGSEKEIRPVDSKQVSQSIDKPGVARLTHLNL